MRNGGTDFSEALKYALEVALRPHNNIFDLTHLIMMSDGGDSYPIESVIAIQNSNIFREKKFKFTAVGYGQDDFSSLR